MRSRFSFRTHLRETCYRLLYLCVSLALILALSPYLPGGWDLDPHRMPGPSTVVLMILAGIWATRRAAAKAREAVVPLLRRRRRLTPPEIAAELQSGQTPRALAEQVVLSFTDPEDLRALATDLLEQSISGFETHDYRALAEAVGDWSATADVYRNPALLQDLQTRTGLANGSDEEAVDWETLRPQHGN